MFARSGSKEATHTDIINLFVELAIGRKDSFTAIVFY